jgi:hypothetical protein
MYGLPQAVIIANKQLQKRLAPHGYRPVPITPGLWQHDMHPISFALVVDDLGIKYVNKADAEHLVDMLQQVGYKLSQEWDGNQYCGLTLKWNYDERTRVWFQCLDTLNMPSNISNILLLPDLNIRHIIGTNPSTVQKYNMLMPSITLRFLMRQQRNLYRRSLVPFYSTLELLTILCSSHLVHYQYSNCNLQKRL